MNTASAILMVVTSHDRIDADHATGLWFEEFAVPFTKFRAAGYAVVVASPRGGDTPIDARSLENYQPTAANESAKAALRGTKELDASITATEFAAVFFPGGHGTMFDLPDNPQVQRLVREFAEADKVIASVCHGPACLVGVMVKDGAAFVKGRKVTAFTDSEERAVQLDKAMPFLLESRLREQGASFVPAADWADNIVVDDKLVTGQNPQSSGSAADAVIRLLSSGR
jgi:putative intracellular protease/amidase